MLCTSRVQELSGKQCQGIGVKIGKATLFLMDKAYLLRSPLVMAVVWSLIMLHPIAGLLARPSLEGNFGRPIQLLNLAPGANQCYIGSYAKIELKACILIWYLKY